MIIILDIEKMKMNYKYSKNTIMAFNDLKIIN